MLVDILKEISENPENLYLKEINYENKNISYLFYLIIKLNLSEIQELQKIYPSEVGKGLENIKENLEDSFHVFLLNSETAENNFESIQFLSKNGFEMILKKFFENFDSFSYKTPMNIDILSFILKNTDLNKSLFDRNDLSKCGYFLTDHKLKKWATFENIKFIFENISSENKEKFITKIFYILEAKEAVSFIDTQIPNKKKKSFILTLARNKYISSDTFIEIYEKNKHLLNTELNIFQELLKENKANSIMKLINKNPDKLYETEWGEEDNNIFIMCLTKEKEKLDYNIERYGIDKYKKYKENEIKIFNFIMDLESKMKKSYLNKDNSESAEIFERITAEKYIYSNNQIFKKFMEETLKIYSIEEFPDNFFRKLFKNVEDTNIIDEIRKFELSYEDNYIHLINNPNKKMFEYYIQTEKDIKKCEKIFGYAFKKEKQEAHNESMLNAFQISLEKGIDIINTNCKGTPYLDIIYERLGKYKTCFEYRNSKSQEKVNNIELLVEKRIKFLLKDVNKQEFDEKSLISPLINARKELILQLVDEKIINIETALEIAEKHEQGEKLIAIISKSQLDDVLKNDAIVNQKSRNRL